MRSYRNKIKRLESELPETKEPSKERNDFDLLEMLTQGANEYIERGILSPTGEIVGDIDYVADPHKHSMACLFALFLRGQLDHLSY